ncbi:hypothetical protein NC653_011718 [Populus alba x Populus x berolinensis]|uniref:SAUR family protein n=1 Tax=Populus alba x Populus x berolinensis TaxID=444605 RepID=A0AAD6R494_9ROSI|nr:hypothetical protein NC653_011718 [Populus alba x Populus x berolinensis]
MHQDILKCRIGSKKGEAVPRTSYALHMVLSSNTQLPCQSNSSLHILIKNQSFLFLSKILTIFLLFLHLHPNKMMAIRLPRILQAKQNLLRGSSPARDVRKGYVAVYVGEEEKKRFVIPVSHLNQPSFQELLSKAEEEFGFDHQMGGLTIPCREDIFIDLTSRLNGL